MSHEDEKGGIVGVFADEEFEVHGPRLNRYANAWAMYLGHHWAYRREFGETKIDRLLLCGGTAHTVPCAPVWLRKLNLYRDDSLLCATNGHEFLCDRERNVAGLVLLDPPPAAFLLAGGPLAVLALGPLLRREFRIPVTSRFRASTGKRWWSSLTRQDMGWRAGRRARAQGPEH